MRSGQARALAIGGDENEGPVVLLTLDNCGVPENVTEEVAVLLKENLRGKGPAYVFNDAGIELRQTGANTLPEAIQELVEKAH